MTRPRDAPQPLPTLAVGPGPPGAARLGGSRRAPAAAAPEPALPPSRPARRSGAAAGTRQRGPAGAAAALRSRQPAAYRQRSLLGQFCGVFLLHLKLSGENPGSGPRLPQARAEPPRQKRPPAHPDRLLAGSARGKRISSCSVSLLSLPFSLSPRLGQLNRAVEECPSAPAWGRRRGRARYGRGGRGTGC